MPVSRFRDHQGYEIFTTANQITTRVPSGSALKYGMSASAEVDAFQRSVGSAEGDTAAGQTVLDGAGRLVFD
jgi:3'-phosphoadenosine 5'-phosphosulfate (PAPS) 3'-phosphatase